ncbi:MAG: hypothetical protein H8E44_17620 [Planctomycetes bacterium]|nr:hypothetical protein [Planctomycetota bacterium]
MRFEWHKDNRAFAMLAPLPVFLLCVGAAMAGSEESRAVVLDRLDKMSAAEKKEVQRNQERFYNLPVEERERLRRLHRDIAVDQRAEHLRGLMERYAEWLKTLPSGQRADLLSLPPKDRIEKIKRLMQQQHTSRMRGIVAAELSDEDLGAIVKWMNDFVRRHEKEILDSMPMMKQRLAQIDDQNKRELLIQVAFRIGNRKDALKPDREDIERLKSQLSLKARQQLDKAQQDGHLTELAQRWMRAAMYSRRLAPAVDRDELRKFYNEVASQDPQKREYLESLPPERMLAELTRMYNAHRFEQVIGTKKPFSGWPGAGRRGRGFRGRSGERKPPLGGRPPRLSPDNGKTFDSKRESP